MLTLVVPFVTIFTSQPLSKMEVNLLYLYFSRLNQSNCFQNTPFEETSQVIQDQLNETLLLVRQKRVSPFALIELVQKGFLNWISCMQYKGLIQTLQHEKIDHELLRALVKQGKQGDPDSTVAISIMFYFMAKRKFLHLTNQTDSLVEQVGNIVQPAMFDKRVNKPLVQIYQELEQLLASNEQGKIKKIEIQVPKQELKSIPIAAEETSFDTIKKSIESPKSPSPKNFVFNTPVAQYFSNQQTPPTVSSNPSTIQTAHEKYDIKPKHNSQINQQVSNHPQAIPVKIIPANQKVPDIQPNQVFEGLSLLHCLWQFENIELLNREEGAGYECDKCCKGKERRNALRQSSLFELPQVMTIHLKRFVQLADGQFAKEDHDILFPFVLDLQVFVHPKSPNKIKSCKYRLYAVIEHQGKLNTGHYVTYVRRLKVSPNEEDTRGEWFLFNDHQVAQVNAEQVQQANAYILFYEKM